jgi:hypothetical protein
MEIQIPPFREKRRFGRVKIPQPMMCQVYVPHSRKFRGYRGLIQNIGLEGIYFVCDEKPPLEKDDIRHLIFNVIYNYQKIYRLNFHALVVRIEDQGSKFAVAIKFLSDPIYYPIKEIDSELRFLDETRIMYQNYELYRETYEIVKRTANIRTEKIANIKKLIDKDLYEIDIEKLAQNFIGNISKRMSRPIKDKDDI